ncbi:MAG: MBL fold metallo-hydrolase [Alphaproteobacteria bacterium]|nr:MBL fold metallo-hydrolase [Alphaproteobacteria bacterium]
MTPELVFHGGAGTVTGSCYEIIHAGGRLMIDCGMFQGNKTVRALNYRDFPFTPSEVDTLLLTHAHIDHTGLIPKLHKHGFKGRIHATAPTADLASFMLPDSGYIQESEVERLNRRNKRRGKPEVEPIYTRKDAEACLKRFESVSMEQWFAPMAGIKARYWNAGHILGSASIELMVENPSAGSARPVHMLFSGDLGPDEKVFHLEPDAPAGFDYILCESTYGDREREDATVDERRAALKREILDALQAGGNLLIPAFAVERTQELLHDIGVLMAQNEIPTKPVFLDSPLANNATKVFIEHAASLDDIAMDEAELFKNPNFNFTSSVEESKAINKVKGGAIIMAASGMCDAGRIRHHLRNNLYKKDATVLFVGYQAPGTLGSFILNGEEEVRIHGREVKVNARIRRIGNYSAHADQGELIAWVKERLPVHAGLFLTHGDDKAREVLKEHLASEGMDAERIVLPGLDERATLGVDPDQKPISVQEKRARVAPADMATDWYNDYASLLLKLGRQLEAMEDGDARRALLRKMRALLKT